MEKILNNLADKSVDLLINSVISLLILVIGFKIVNIIEKKLKHPSKLNKIDQSVRTFLVSFL